ncbi:MULTISPECIES: ABC transporter substrate-binding protein [Kribbella]|jgi:peptide/nickel transport system substrate-binding protein|uniref:Peptide/nickel transport system substrate-binding protein n=1 Tax=Kribbella pratensis TaxID=2512112 RepID=A0ABY2FKT7_9ACTN|nr:MULTISPECIES: ABC transporter substrate-binding protein [Kribbella]TDW86203.1 peptide/nickel transport system substrate-binding protein [Kribbella sp. VKM Ac-2566]TDW93737.1 peptide/nickel transport system substrate-binding protein [Kribbella pratensis]
MKHLSRAVALAAVLALAAAACNANDKSGTTGGSTAAAEQGGTFHILSTSKEISYDPAKSQNLGISGIHLVLRGLTSWKTDPSKPTELVPDLATDTGQVTDGGKTWTYKLKPGLKYADGSPIVAADIKYGVERSFAPELSGGLGYHKSLLVGGDKYTGPYKGGDLASIETPDETTIVFKLNKPYGDWPWIVSMPAFSPVPKKADTDPAHYGEKPMASGPYQVQSYTPGSKLVLTRNPNWDKSTDPARTGLPDSIVTDMGLQPDVVNQRLIADAGDDKFAATTGTSVPAALIPTITGNPAVKARVATSPSGALEYLAMNTKRPALANPAVRKAIEYAVDKQAVQVAEGGPEYGGEIASTLITPGIDGYTKYDSYEAPPAGDPAKAKQMLAAAGVSNLNLVLAADNTTGLGVAQAIQQGLKRAGITVTIKPLDSEPLTDLITGNKPDFDLTVSSWLPDFPSAIGNIQPLFASSEIGNGGYNISRYSNPAVDTAIAAATAEPDRTKAAGLWAALDKQIMADAPVVPLIYARNAFLHGSKVQNFYLSSYPPYANTLIVGLSK